MGCLPLSPSRSALHVASWHGQPAWPGWPWVAWPSPPQLQNLCCPSKSRPSQPLLCREPAGGCSHPFSLSDGAAVGCSPPRAPMRAGSERRDGSNQQVPQTGGSEVTPSLIQAGFPQRASFVRWSWLPSWQLPRAAPGWLRMLSLRRGSVACAQAK